MNYVGWTRAFAYNRHPYYVVLSYGTPALYVTETLQWVLPYSSISPTYLEKGGCHRDLPDSPRPEHVDLFPSVPFFRRRNRWKRIASRESRRTFPALLAIIILTQLALVFQNECQFEVLVRKTLLFLVQVKLIFTWKVSLELVLQMKLRMTHFYPAFCRFFFFNWERLCLGYARKHDVLIIWRVHVAAPIRIFISSIMLVCTMNTSIFSNFFFK